MSEVPLLNIDCSNGATEGFNWKMPRLAKIKRSWTRLCLEMLLLPLKLNLYLQIDQVKRSRFDIWIQYLTSLIIVGVYFAGIVICAMPTSVANITTTERWGPLVLFVFWLISYAIAREATHRREKDLDAWLAPLVSLRCDNPDIELAWVRAFKSKNALMFFGNSRLFRGLHCYPPHMAALHHIELPVMTSEVNSVMASTKPYDHCPGFLEYLDTLPKTHDWCNMRMSWVALDMFNSRRTAKIRTVIFLCITLGSLAVGYLLFGRIPIYCKSWFFGIEAHYAPTTALDPEFIFSFFFGGLGTSIILMSISQMILEFSNEGSPIEMLRNYAESFCLHSQQIALESVHGLASATEVHALAAPAPFPFIDLATSSGLAAFSSLLFFVRDFRREQQMGPNPAIFVLVAVFAVALIFSVVAVLLIYSRDVVFHPSMDQMSANVFIWTASSAIVIEVIGLLSVILVAALQNSKLVQLKNFLVEASSSLYFRSLMSEKENKHNQQQDASQALRIKANQLTQLATSIDTNPISLLGFPLTFTTLSTLISLLVTGVVALLKYLFA